MWAKRGAFSWHDAVPAALAESYERAMAKGTYDGEGGGHYYCWDSEHQLWWSWDSPGVIAKKVPAVVQ